MADTLVRVSNDGTTVVLYGAAQISAMLAAGLTAFEAAKDAALVATGADVDAAQASATAAQSSEDDADASATQAASSATNSALSAAVALAGTTRYPDSAAGLAATAEGGYFVVVGSGDTSAILYREVGGAAVEQTRYPSLQALQNILVPLLATSYGASGGGDPVANRNAFEAAVNAAVLRGGGTIYVPPANAPYDIAAKTWSDVGGYGGCIRLKANVYLHIAAGATVRMAANQVANVNTMVVLLGGSDSGVFGEGTIDGGSLLSQAGYASGYLQNGPAGVFLLASLQLNRVRIGAGEQGYLTIQNCFGNAVNGGGSTGAGRPKYISVVGIKTDNVGEGCQIEVADHVEMKRIVSLNSLGNMAGDGAELSDVRHFVVEDIYSEKAAGGGFDLFGCQKGTMSRVTSVNSYVHIQDATPVLPCEDVTATDLLVIFTDPARGVGEGGIFISSASTTAAPKNIRVQGSVRNIGGGLRYGVLVSQAAAAATYGGDYDLDVKSDGATFAGLYVSGKAPRLRGKVEVRNSQFGMEVDTAGTAVADMADWNLHLDARNCATADIRIQGGGANPSGVLGGHFTTLQGDFRTLIIRNRTPRILTTPDNPAESLGYSVVRFTGNNAGFWDHGADGDELTVIYTIAGNIYDYATSGAYAVTKLKGGVGSKAYAAGDTMRLIYDATAAAGTGTGVWREL